MSVVDDLIAARALIADPACWIKGDFRREVDGRMCYCVDGALRAVGVGYAAAWRTLADQTTGPLYGPILFNDAPETTHADVMALFDRAIAAERAKAVKP